MNTLLTGALEGSQLMQTLQSFLPFILILAVVYFIMIRPQQKRQKEITRKREALKGGDKIVTAGGIHGTIKEVKDTYFVVEISDNVRIKIDKTSVFTNTQDAASK